MGLDLADLWLLLAARDAKEQRIGNVIETQYHPGGDGLGEAVGCPRRISGGDDDRPADGARAQFLICRGERCAWRKAIMHSQPVGKALERDGNDDKPAETQKKPGGDDPQIE